MRRWPCLGYINSVFASHSKYWHIIIDSLSVHCGTNLKLDKKKKCLLEPTSNSCEERWGHWTNIFLVINNNMLGRAHNKKLFLNCINHNFSLIIHAYKHPCLFIFITPSSKFILFVRMFITAPIAEFYIYNWGIVGMMVFYCFNRFFRLSSIIENKLPSLIS